ncbi:MAG: cyclic nucleotide-binding domain-containing protein [Desulfobulbaceae bacterium]|nr:cyclic nucleotide-binding domain-containing protein [Desulfobulbaceae bacterium]
MISIVERQDCLKSCRLFSGMAASAVRLLAESMEAEYFAAMEAVCSHGEEADRLYVVQAGRLAVFLPGEEAPVQYLTAGDIFGEYGMFIGARLATVRAEEESILLSLGYERGRAFFLAQPAALMELLAVAVRRLRVAEERLQSERRQ